MPPVTEFWEIPLYSRDGYFVDNPSNHYSINSYMLKRDKLYTEGDKLAIYIQSDEPLRAVLDRTERCDLVMLLNSQDRLWTSDGFRTS